MKNDFEIRGEITAIFLRRRDGSIVETIIDTEDLPRVQEFPNTWCVYQADKTNALYVFGQINESGKKKIIKLHRWITNAPEGLVVDHINHDTLDNRKANLRIVTRGQNLQNLKGARADNQTSGIRGVCWAEHAQKWRAYFYLNGKQHHIGYFDSLEEAANAVAEARKNNMPFSKEALL